ncbi:hypothetical protein MRY87_03075 [bacterium]|nr:hypothetical protein [bacterium]
MFFEEAVDTRRAGEGLSGRLTDRDSSSNGPSFAPQVRSEAALCREGFPSFGRNECSPQAAQALTFLLLSSLLAAQAPEPDHELVESRREYVVGWVPAWSTGFSQVQPDRRADSSQGEIALGVLERLQQERAESLLRAIPEQAPEAPLLRSLLLLEKEQQWTTFSEADRPTFLDPQQRAADLRERSLSNIHQLRGELVSALVGLRERVARERLHIIESSDEILDRSRTEPFIRALQRELFDFDAILQVTSEEREEGQDAQRGSKQESEQRAGMLLSSDGGEEQQEIPVVPLGSPVTVPDGGAVTSLSTPIPSDDSLTGLSPAPFRSETRQPKQEPPLPKPSALPDPEIFPLSSSQPGLSENFGGLAPSSPPAPPLGPSRRELGAVSRRPSATAVRRFVLPEMTPHQETVVADLLVRSTRDGTEPEFLATAIEGEKRVYHYRARHYQLDSKGNPEEAGREVHSRITVKQDGALLVHQYQVTPDSWISPGEEGQWKLGASVSGGSRGVRMSGGVSAQRSVEVAGVRSARITIQKDGSGYGYAHHSAAASLSARSDLALPSSGVAGFLGGPSRGFDVLYFSAPIHTGGEWKQRITRIGGSVHPGLGAGVGVSASQSKRKSTFIDFGLRLFRGGVEHKFHSLNKLPEKRD